MHAPVLHEFLISHRDEILSLSRAELGNRVVPAPTELELANGLPLFFDQLIAILKADKGDQHAGQEHVSASAKLHGGELLRLGLTVGQVVQDYGSICQSVTALASRYNVSITTDEFQIFNQSMDNAVAQAVTEYELQRDAAEGAVGTTKLGFLAHEMRNLLSTAMLTFGALTRGNVGVNGNTGALLGRSLQRMRVLIDRALAEVRIEAGINQSQQVSIAGLIEEVEIVATIEAKKRGIQLSVDPGAFDVCVDGDEQILTAAVANLVQNALKFTRPDTHVRIRAHTEGHRVLIDVQDECGGLPPGKAATLFEPFEQRGRDHSGLGLGLAISLKGVQASGGDIRVHDQPGRGCTFTVDLPRRSASA